MKCKYSGCERDAVWDVTIRLPRQWDETTFLAEEVREQHLPMCADHAEVMRDFGIRIEPLDSKAG